MTWSRTRSVACVHDLSWDPADPFHGAMVDSPAELRSAYRSTLLRIAAAATTQSGRRR